MYTHVVGHSGLLPCTWSPSSQCRKMVRHGCIRATSSRVSPEGGSLETVQFARGGILMGLFGGCALGWKRSGCPVCCCSTAPVLTCMELLVSSHLKVAEQRCFSGEPGSFPGPKRLCPVSLLLVFQCLPCSADCS